MIRPVSSSLHFFHSSFSFLSCVYNRHGVGVEKDLYDSPTRFTRDLSLCSGLLDYERNRGRNFERIFFYSCSLMRIWNVVRKFRGEIFASIDRYRCDKLTIDMIELKGDGISFLAIEVFLTRKICHENDN